MPPGMHIVLALIAAILLAGLLHLAWRARHPRRTLRHWQGKGVREDLSAWEAALLLALHPGTIFALLLDDLARAGGARLRSFDPIRVDRRPAPPDDEAGAVLDAALDREGGITPQAALGVLEALWRRLDARMAGWSGRATAVHYRRVVAERWEAAEASVDLPPGAEAWLSLAEAVEVWDRIGSGPGWDRLRCLFRSGERVRHELFPWRWLSERAARTREGFLAWRPDLVFFDRATDPDVPVG